MDFMDIIDMVEDAHHHSKSTIIGARILIGLEGVEIYPEDVLELVCNAQGITISELLSSRRSSRISVARAAATFLYRKMEISYPEIAKRLHLANHTSALYCQRNMEGFFRDRESEEQLVVVKDYSKVLSLEEMRNYGKSVEDFEIDPLLAKGKGYYSRNDTLDFRVSRESDKLYRIILSHEGVSLGNYAGEGLQDIFEDAKNKSEMRVKRKREEGIHLVRDLLDKK